MYLDIRLSAGDDHTYTTGELIDGYFGCKLKKDMSADDFNISLFGRAHVRLKDNRLRQTQGHVVGTHTFLRMSQPIESTCRPQHGSARRERTSTIAFSFTLPERLLPYACTCTAGLEGQTDDHLGLPPSFGSSASGKPFSGENTAKDAQVIYTIEVRFRMHFFHGSSEIIRKSREICVVPSGLAKSTDDKTDIFDAGILGPLRAAPVSRVADSPLGRLEVTMAARLDLELPPQRLCTAAGAMASVPMHLTFRPTRINSSPPIVEDVAITIFSTTSWGRARKDEAYSKGVPDQGWQQRTQKIRLPKVRLDGLVWTKHPCQYDQDAPVYSTTFRLPIQLSNSPKPRGLNRASFFLPAFSSCTVSRRYSIGLDFSYRAACASSVRRHLVQRSHLMLDAPMRVFYPQQSLPETKGRWDGALRSAESKVAEEIQIEAAEQVPPAYTPVLR